MILKITVENFSEVRKKVLEVGIEKVQYGPRGEARSFVTKDGEEFEFDPKSFEEFRRASLLMLGRRSQSHGE